MRQGQLVLLMLLILGSVGMLVVLGLGSGSVEAGWIGVTKYEYKVVEGFYSFISTNDEKFKNPDERLKSFTKYLNKHAKDGWRLHTVHFGIGEVSKPLIFVRQK